MLSLSLSLSHAHTNIVCLHLSVHTFWTTFSSIYWPIWPTSRTCFTPTFVWVDKITHQTILIAKSRPFKEDKTLWVFVVITIMLTACYLKVEVKKRNGHFDQPRRYPSSQYGVVFFNPKEHRVRSGTYISESVCILIYCFIFIII